jgi:hypothetical protein
MEQGTMKLADVMKVYGSSASDSVGRWLNESGNELIRQAKEQGVVDKIVAPVALFHRDGLSDAAEQHLKKDLLRLAVGDSAKEVEKLVKGTKFQAEDEIVETKSKFSDLSEELVLCHIRAELEPLIQQKVDALDLKPPAEAAEYVPTKKEITTLALQLCEAFIRKQVNTFVIEAYNRVEVELIELVGIGEASDNPDAAVEEGALGILNPLARLEEDFEAEINDRKAQAQQQVDEHAQGLNDRKAQAQQQMDEHAQGLNDRKAHAQQQMDKKKKSKKK